MAKRCSTCALWGSTRWIFPRSILGAAFSTCGQGTYGPAIAIPPSWFFGYPTSLRALEVGGERSALNHVRVKMTATIDTYIAPSAAKCVHKVKLHKTERYSSDGLSGAGVYHVAEDARG